MNTISCIIVDDQPSAIDLLSSYIREVSFLDLVHTTNMPLEGFQFLQENPIDLVFLDVEMPLLNGIQFLKMRSERNRFILTSAHSDPEYTLAGFEHGIIDYLKKPLEFDRFLKAVNRLNPENPLLQKTDAAPKEMVPAYLLVKSESKSKMIKINTGDIVYISSDRNYVSIYTEKEKAPIVTLQTIKKMEEELCKGPFFRTHKSYIVATDRIHTIDGNQVLLQSPPYKSIAVPISETYKKALVDFLEGRRHQ